MKKLTLSRETLLDLSGPRGPSQITERCHAGPSANCNTARCYPTAACQTGRCH